MDEYIKTFKFPETIDFSNCLKFFYHLDLLKGDREKITDSLFYENDFEAQYNTICGDGTNEANHHNLPHGQDRAVRPCVT